MHECVILGRTRRSPSEESRLPVAQFVGRGVDGRLRVEREGRDPPGLSRATGLFDAETLPETRREYDEIARLIDGDPDEETVGGANDR